MKIEKNKLVFAHVILGVVFFIGSYSVIILGGDEEPIIENNQIPVPKLKDEQKEYESKLDALNDLKEVRQTNAPSIYDERLLDSTGVYDPDLLDKEKRRIVDSIYRHGRIDYASNSYRNSVPKQPNVNEKPKIESVLPKMGPIISTKELALEHHLFFSSAPAKNQEINANKKTDVFIHVAVNGSQEVKAFSRLEMRLVKPAMINNKLIPKNTYIYGFVSFKPNRTMIHITNINHQEVSLKALNCKMAMKAYMWRIILRLMLLKQLWMMPLEILTFRVCLR